MEICIRVLKEFQGDVVEVTKFVIRGKENPEAMHLLLDAAIDYLFTSDPGDGFKVVVTRER